MRLVTKRLVLREVRKTDAHDIVQNINNLKVSQYLATAPYPYRLKDAKYHIRLCAKRARKRKKEDYDFIIELKLDNRVIGGTGIYKVDRFSQKAEIGYWVSEKYWRQGIGLEVLNSLIGFAFHKLKVRRLQAEVFCQNRASVKLLERAGFKKEGFLRQAARAKSTGKWHDVYVYGLIRSDIKL
jgi:RimJ/RimL family protein N-acetyltransferase